MPTDIIGPDESAMTHNADVYWHYASDPVQRAQLLGTFNLGAPQTALLPLPADADVVFRVVPRGGRGQTWMAGPGDADPLTVHVPGIGSVSGVTGEILQNEHIPVTPTRSTLNAELPFLQFRDEGDASAKSQIRSRRTPTGAQNVVTDWNASGDGRIYKVNITAGSPDIQIRPGEWFDADVTWHPVPYWSEAVVPHSFRGGQGVRIFGAAGGADLYTTVTAVNGAIVTVATAPDVSASPGAFCHDDTAALKAAFDNRGHIWIPEGRYWVNQRLLWPATSTGLNQQIIIEGDGEWRSVLMFNHDGNGIQLVGSLQTGNPNSGVYDAVIRNLGIWCVPSDNKEGIRTTSKGHGLAFTATTSNSGVPGPSTGNVRVENVLLQGWGRWGLWSDNLQSAFLTNIKCYHNLSGGMAIVGNATIRGTSQQEDNAIEITNSLIVYSGPNDFGLSGDSVRTLGGGSISAWSRSLTVSGGLTANDVGRIVKLIDGPGVGGSTHVTMIESVQSGTACTISMPVWQAASGFAVQIYQSSVANIFLHNSNNVRICGGTHQGNWVSYSGNAGGVRAENLDCLRIDGLWEEDAGGSQGAAIDLYNCRAVDVDSTHTGGSLQPPDLPPTAVGHAVGIRMTDVQGVTVRGCYIGQSGAGTAYATHGNSQGVIFENCYGADWVAGLANTDVVGEPVIIGPGCHSLSFDNAQTSTLALWDEQWTNAVVNPNFLDGLTGWSTPTSGTITQPGAPYTTLPARWERYVVVNSQALGSGLVDVLTQDIPVPDSRQSGQWTLSWDHYIQSRGAGGSSDNNTVVTIEVRTATAGYTVRSVTLTADAGYGLPVGRWMRLCIKTNLDGGVTGRFFRIRFSNAGTANSPIFRIGNVRLQPGISATFDFDQPITQERGGPLYAPLYFKALNPAQFPPPPPPADAISIVNIAGILKIGSGGTYVPIGTSGAAGHIIQEEGVAVTQRAALNFVGQSLTAADDSTALVTLITLNAATQTTEGIVSTIAQDIGGRKHFHNGAVAYDDTGVPLIAQYTGLTVGAHIQDWWISGSIPLAFIDSQPLLRLGIPNSRAGFVELCDDLGPSQRIRTGGNPSADMTFWLPKVLPSAGQALVSLNLGTTPSADIHLGWANIPLPTGGGYQTIQEDGTALTARAALNFVGQSATAADDSVALVTKVTFNPATQTTEGIVDVATQHFGGRKHFHNGLVGYDDTGVPNIAQYTGLTSGAHIQDWWVSGGAPIAFIDTQPTLRLGQPSSRAGFLELASDASANTQKLASGGTPATNMTFRLPNAVPVAGQMLVALDAGINLGWATPATAISGLTNLKVPRWDSATSKLVDSNIEDRTSTVGTIEFFCNQYLAHRLAADDRMDMYFKTGLATPNYTIIRYEHSAGNLAYSNNTAGGELQFFLNNSINVSGNQLPNFFIGDSASWFQSALRIRPYTSAETPLEIWSPGAGTGCFIVQLDGNLSMIRGQQYVWPNALPSPNTGVKLLQLDTATRNLSWITFTGGGISGTGTATTLTKWLVAGSTIQDSGISDDGTNILALANQFAHRSRANDFIDLYWQGVSGTNQSIFRYEHRSGNLADSANSAAGWGEMQLFMQTQTSPSFFVGNAHSWFQSALRVRPLSGYNADIYSFEVWAPGAPGGANFRIDTSGNLAMIRSVGGYAWPQNHGEAGTPVYVLSNNGSGLLKWYPAPTGSAGANTALSNLTSPTAINQSLSFYGGVSGPPWPNDGAFNIGSPSIRVGAIYLKNAFWLYSGGSTSNPITAGFLDSGSSTYTRLLLYGNGNLIQGGDSARITHTAYHAIEFRGSRRTSTPPGTVSITSGDAYGVLVWQENDLIPLYVGAQGTITSDLQRWQNSGTDQAGVTAL